MQILNFTAIHDRGTGDVRQIGEFDLQLTDDVRLYGCRLMATRDGKHFTYGDRVPPNGVAGAVAIGVFR